MGYFLNLVFKTSTNMPLWLSSRKFFQGGKSIVMQISFVMLIFLLFWDQISGRTKVSEGGKLPQGAPPCPLVEESQLTLEFGNFLVGPLALLFLHLGFKSYGFLNCQTYIMLDVMHPFIDLLKRFNKT